MHWPTRWLAALLLTVGWVAPAAAQGSEGRAGDVRGTEVRVGVYQNPPKVFLSDAGQPSGILGELLVAIAEQEGWSLRAVPCEWQACLSMLQSGQIDLMPDVAWTEQRAQQYDFHKVPALLSWSQLYRHPDVRIGSMLDLAGKRIAVVDGSVQQEYLSHALAGFALKADLVSVRSFAEGFEAVAEGRADAAAANRFFGDLQAGSYKLQSTPVIFQPAQLFYAAGRGRHAGLLAAIDRHLQVWQADPESRYFTVLRRWMVVQEPAVVPAVLWWGLGGLALLLLVAVGTGAMLRREVAIKTRHLRESEDRLATILNSVDAYIYIKDLQRRYQYANRKVCDLFGKPLEAVIGRTDEDFFDEATSTKLRVNDLRVLDQGERVEVEETNRSLQGGEPQTYLSVKLPLRHPDGSIHALCGISTDITRHKQAELAIHRLAFYDSLTGLPNRRLLMERLQHTLAAQARDHQGGALLFIDVDNFKDLNDTLGHDTGDLLLREIAQRLGACLRAQDTLARQGGDEFVVMLAGLSAERAQAAQQARIVAEKILQRLAEPYQLGASRYQTTVSIGVAMFGNQLCHHDELFKQADLAMYRAKADGRSTVRFFDVEMQAQVTQRIAMESDLRRALECGEFCLHFQPQVDAQGRREGAEALVRWQHPERGLVPPMAFIPVAESSGLILPLGRRILQAACEQLTAWSLIESTRHLSVAVNVSARQFRQADFAAQVQAVLQATGAPAHRLKLELTESQLLDDVDAVVAKMQALRDLGVGLSLDDFGTGYSSLSLLKRLPLDQVKIDKTFVRDILTDPQDASIVAAVVTLGRSLQIQVIAEGVETEAQREALLRLGCLHYQGYLFGRPEPIAPLPAGGPAGDVDQRTTWSTQAAPRPTAS